MALRAFLLVGLPFLPPEDALAWAARSLDFAFDCGAAAAVLIPTRAGNGAMDALARRGDFVPPTLAMVERALADGIAAFAERGRVFADLWDLERLRDCAACFPDRAAPPRADESRAAHPAAGRLRGLRSGSVAA